MSKLLLYIFAIVTWGACQSGFGGVRAGDIVADGLLTVTTYSGLGKPLQNWCSTNQFRVSIAADGRYRFEIRPLYETDDVIYYTFDGTNTFYVRYREAVVDVNQKVVDRKPVEKNVHPAYISSGNYPFVPWEDQHRPHILWLVFGAGKYLRDSSTNTMPLPWVPARWSLMSYGFRVEYKTSSAPPYHLREIEFVRDLKLDLFDDKAEMDRLELNAPSGEAWFPKWKKELQQRREDWVDGFVAGKLESGSFTNQNGLEIPQAFTFNAFHPKWLSQMKKVRWKYVGIVTNVFSSNLAPVETFQPPIVSVVQVEDSRFRFRDATRAVNGINYPLTGKNWPARTSAEKEQEFQADINNPEFSARFYSAVPYKRLGVLVFVIASFILPLFLYLSSKRRKRRSNTPAN